ncbi:MAG: diguanylate cyclase [Pyrinomonadaceae bacterium]
MPTRRRPKRDLRPSLVFLNGDLLAVPIPLEREEVILGRSIGADVRINDNKVSRRHAKIETLKNTETGEEVYVLKDLGSVNGTFLNGQQVRGERLQNGDKITIGKHILRFELLDEIDREYQLQIRRLLAHDDLTGLLSSRSFFSELRRESARARQFGGKFCVMMMDIDFFKLVNDTYGHLTGSKTLEEIGRCITETLRSGDVAARFGGEEFAAFLLDAELTQALIGAERIRQSIEEFNFSVIKRGRVGDTHKITISIGISSFPDDSEDPIELVEMADSALYRAKSLGRNKVCAYRELSQEEADAILPPRNDVDVNPIE